MGSPYQELRVWKLAMQLAGEIYKSTDHFPDREKFGLTSQIRRAAVSVASNIAEGKGHRSDREFLHVLYHARGSLFEVDAAGKAIQLRGRKGDDATTTDNHGNSAKSNGFDQLSE